MTELFLRGLTTYGPLVLGLAMVPAAFGVPVPIGVLLIAAGALVRQGFVDWRALLACAWAGAVLGDTLSYAIGHRAGPWVQGRLSERYAAVWDQAERLFRRHAGWAVFATSWLVRGLAIPTNVIAGSSSYTFWRFVACDTLGKLLWVLIHAGLGYAFASQWRLISQAVSRYGAWVGVGAIVAVGIYLLQRFLRENQGHAAA